MGQVISGGMMLGVVVGKIGGPAGPVETKLGLGFPAAEPMEAHPDHFDAALDDGVLNESRSHPLSCQSGWEIWVVSTPFL